MPKLFELDEPIQLAGSNSTIRQLFQAGKARPRRRRDGSCTAEIDKGSNATEEFSISEVDYKLIGGE